MTKLVISNRGVFVMMQTIPHHLKKRFSKTSKANSSLKVCSVEEEMVADYKNTGNSISTKNDIFHLEQP